MALAKPAGGNLDKVLALLGRSDGGVQQKFLIHVTGIKCNETLGQLSAECIDLSEGVGQTHHMVMGKDG